MSTLADQTFTAVDWVSLNTLSGIVVGNPFIITNKSTGTLIVQEFNTKPSDTSYDGRMLHNIRTNYAEIIIASGSLEIWGRASSPSEEVRISIED